MTVFINPGFLPPVLLNRINRSAMTNTKENPLYENVGRTSPNDNLRLDAVVSSGAAAVMKNQFEASQLLASSGMIVTPSLPVIPSGPSEPHLGGFAYPSSSMDEFPMDFVPLPDGIGIC